MGEPRLCAISGNLKPSPVVGACGKPVEGSLPEGHGRTDYVLGIQLGVVVLPERLRILHRVYRHLDQAGIESSRHQDLDVL